MNFEDDLGIKSFDDPKVPQSVRDYLINNLKVDYEKKSMKLIKTKKEYDYHLNKLKDLMKNDMTIPTVKRNFFIDRSILDPRIKNDPMFLGVASDTVFLSKEQMNDLKSKIKTTSTDSVTTYNPTKGIIQTQSKTRGKDIQTLINRLNTAIDVGNKELAVKRYEELAKISIKDAEKFKNQMQNIEVKDSKFSSIKKQILDWWFKNVDATNEMAK